MRSEDDTARLGKKTISGGFATAAMQVATTLISLGGLAVIARVVPPTDFGLLAKVAAATGVFSIVGDMGLSIATIQSEHINHRQLTALFWVNVFVAASVAGLMIVASPIISWFYGDPRVLPVASALALNVIVVGIGAQHLALLKRRMRFTVISVVQVLSLCVGVGAAVFGAVVLKLGFWSLLLQPFLIAAVNTLGFWCASRWVPSFEIRGTGIRDKLKIGGHYTLSTVINYFARNGDNVLIAKFWGEQSLGYYAKAYGLLLLPMSKLAAPMSQVAVPALSRLNSEPERYRMFFRKGVAIAMVFQIPVVVFAAVSGREIVLATLGPAWQPSVPIFYALVPNLLAAATAPATQWVFISRGDTARLVRMVAVNSLFVMIGFLIGLPYGAIGVAWSFSITTCLVRIPSILYCFKPSPVSARDFFPFMMPPAGCSVVAALPCLFLANTMLCDSTPIVVLTVKSVVFGSVYIPLILGTTAGRDVFTRITGYVQSGFFFLRAARQVV